MDIKIMLILNHFNYELYMRDYYGRGILGCNRITFGIYLSIVIQYSNAGLNNSGEKSPASLSMSPSFTVPSTHVALTLHTAFQLHPRDPQ